MTSLPIETLLPELRQALSQSSAVVLQAPPGAGKTTRVPLALLDQPWLEGQSILVLQPRRLAARHAAEFMASQLGETVGQTVGYTIRFERKRSHRTRIEVVTEGVLTRRLQNDPELSDVGLVIFDEFHERNIHSDLALALCRDAQLGLRNDLKLLVMSATLDAAPIAGLLDNCPVLTSDGRSFPVTVRYLSHFNDQKIAENVAAGVRVALKAGEGDILAFLPGAGEIRRCIEQLKDLTHIALCPLFGGLPFEQQRQALVPGERRRVVLATNIAETSLTIEGIEAVVDSGWERRPRFDIGTGVTRLELKRISVASATQRQGRAGRLGPGRCYRLWSEGQQAQLLPQAPAEIRSADLAPLLLELSCWGETKPECLTWLDPPSESHLHQARNLLKALDAIDDAGIVTVLGQKMVRFPLAPRLARLLVSAEQDGEAALGCDLAALLSERDLLSKAHTPTRTLCDLETRWQLLTHSPHVAGVKAVRRISTDLQRFVGVKKKALWPDDIHMVQRWLAVAYPDRIARQRQVGSDRYLLSDGSGAQLSRCSGLDAPECLVALVLEHRNDQSQIVVASTIDRSVLEEVFGAQFKTLRQVYWNEREDRVVAVEIVSYNALQLESRPVKATQKEQIEATLDGVRRLGIERLAWSRETEQLIGRVRTVARFRAQDGWPDLNPEALTEQLDEWLAPFLSGITTRAALERFNPLAALKTLITWNLQQQLERLVPERIAVPSGSRIRIDYSGEGPPVLAVKLQELFGLQQGPTVLEGQLALQVHLLSPAGRPLAMTQNLENFWNEVYPEVRKEMRGRYPKHPWPDDPWNTQATARTKRGTQKKN